MSDWKCWVLVVKLLTHMKIFKSPANIFVLALKIRSNVIDIDQKEHWT